jgi:hypothetical protein
MHHAFTSILMHKIAKVTSIYHHILKRVNEEHNNPLVKVK